MYTRLTHAKAVFGPWWVGVNLLWTAISSADTLANKYASDAFKQNWNSLWITPKWGWSVWITGFCVITAVFAFESSFRQIKKTEKEPERPFLTIQLAADNLLDTSEEISRRDYLFLRNFGKRTAFDIKIADLSRTWNGNTYIAKFTRTQLLEPTPQGIPITPEMSLNGVTYPRHSIQARIWFCSLLVGEDEQIKVPSATEIVHEVSIAYTDQGVARSNSLVLAAEYRTPGVFVTVRDQH
jgi:hypothetical protein